LNSLTKGEAIGFGWSQHRQPKKIQLIFYEERQLNSYFFVQHKTLSLLILLGEKEKEGLNALYTTTMLTRYS